MRTQKVIFKRRTEPAVDTTCTKAELDKFSNNHTVLVEIRGSGRAMAKS